MANPEHRYEVVAHEDLLRFAEELKEASKEYGGRLVSIVHDGSRFVGFIERTYGAPPLPPEPPKSEHDQMLEREYETEQERNARLDRENP